MSGEKSVKSGNDGQKMTVELLKLIGWEPISEQIQYDCSLGMQHKTKSAQSNKENHDIDCLYQYDSPLIHRNRDIAFISVKHNADEYSSKSNIISHIRDLAQSIECASKSYILREQYLTITEREEVFCGLLFWLSSNENERERDMITQVSSRVTQEDDIEKLATPRFRNVDFDSIYIVDNKRATFLLSVVKTAQSYRRDINIKFLYPHTGSNMQGENLLLSGGVLPIQYINSSIIPIILEDKEKISFLLFCNIEFDKEHFRRLIWLAQKLVGFANEVVIYFKKYDETRHGSIARATIQEFNDKDYNRKIQIRQFTTYDYITLKETQYANTISDNIPQKLEKNRKLSSQINDDDLNKILPYGEMLKPILSASILSDTDLKAFLINKGIYLKSGDKQATIPVFVNLLLSPQELDDLRGLLITKEDRPKLVSREAQWHKPNINLAEAIKGLDIAFERINISYGCKVIGKPTFKILSDNEAVLNYELERQNSTKDLITGITRHNGSISIRLQNNFLTAKMEYTAQETYKANAKFFDNIESSLKQKDYINDSFQKRKFSDFDNETRVDFLLSFRTITSEYFTYIDIQNVKFKPDTSIEKLPFDLESLAGKAKELNINGEKLDKTHYFTKLEYKSCLLLERVKIKFKFKIDDKEGYCLIEFGYPSTINNDDFSSEFSTSTYIIKDKKNTHLNLNSIAKLLSRKVEGIVTYQYEQFKSRMNKNA